jgi:glycosyltransferase involved in cell wall biosynthesis
MALEKIAGRWTDRLVVINKEDAEAGLRYRIVPEKNLIHMPGIGVDINFYNREKNTENCKQQIRETLNINCRHKIILLAAEFIPRKQHKIALEGLSRMHRRDAILLFAGNGPLKAKIESLALSLGVSDRVRFMGFSSDIPQLMACSDIVLLASKREGLPRVLLEAMAMERPIVASNIRGCLELLEDECGYLFPEGNAQALANTLEEALDNPEEAARRAHQAHIKLKEKYSLGEVLAKHRRLYDELLGNL